MKKKYDNFHIFAQDFKIYQKVRHLQAKTNFPPKSLDFPAKMTKFY